MEERKAHYEALLAELAAGEDLSKQLQAKISAPSESKNGLFDIWEIQWDFMFTGHWTVVSSPMSVSETNQSMFARESDDDDSLMCGSAASSFGSDRSKTEGYDFRGSPVGDNSPLCKSVEVSEDDDDEDYYSDSGGYSTSSHLKVEDTDTTDGDVEMFPVNWDDEEEEEKVEADDWGSVLDQTKVCLSSRTLQE